MGSERIDHESVAREVDRGLDHIGKRELAEASMRLDHAGDRARNARREMTGETPIGEVSVRVEIHVPTRARRGHLAVVDGLHRSVVEAYHHETAAAEIAGLGVDHRERETHRDGRIHRVTAAAENVPTDPARDGVARDDHRAAALGDSCVADVVPGERGWRRGPSRIGLMAASERGQQGDNTWRDREEVHEVLERLWVRGGGCPKGSTASNLAARGRRQTLFLSDAWLTTSSTRA